MDFDSIENLNEDQILDLYNDIVEGAEGGGVRELLAEPRCYKPGGSFKWCCGGWECYLYCDMQGALRYGMSGPVRCK